jgi:type IX secretion system PorP/SprF family membrane protein
MFIIFYIWRIFERPQTVQGKMKNIQFLFLAVAFLLSEMIHAQETLPVYTDYLSDNVYLLHPAAAGVGNCSKLRLTGRQQWMDSEEFPQLQTISFHTRVGESTGVGIALFNDKNGYHSQIGGQITYAYHINMGSRYDTNQFSFGLSLMAVRNTLDETEFLLEDPVITQQINSRNYFNADVGAAYHYEGFFSYLTAKNILMSARNLYNDEYESLNLRRYIASMGYYFGDETMVQFEPSIMAQFIERTQEKFLDANLKVYVPFENGEVWGGLSYRRGFDVTEYDAPNYFTPLLGVNYRNFMFSYSYTRQQNDIIFADGGFHQVTLGYNFGCKEKFSRQSACPNLSGGF